MSAVATLWEELRAVATRRRDYPALWFDEQCVSYTMLLQRAERVATVLWGMGLRPGDRVAYLAANRPEYVDLLLACSRIGLTLVPLNTRYGENDLAHALSTSRPRALFMASHFRHQDFEALVSAAERRGALATVAQVVRLDRDASAGTLLFQDLMARTPHDSLPDVAMLSRQDVLLQFTSGSSGPAKAVRLLQPQLLAAMTRVRDLQRIVADDVALSFLPYFHVYGGAITLLVPLLAGATVVIQSAFEPSRSLEALVHHRCTVLYGVGPVYQAWFDMPTFDRYDLSSIRTGVCASGSPAAARIARQVRARIGPLHSHFGMTETAGVGTMSRHDDPAEIATDTAGRPLPGVEVGVFVPGSDERLPAEQEGELRLRGPVLTPGYLERPDANSRLFARDGWLCTGDRAWLGEDGALRIAGRLDDRLRTGGENFNPQEVEDLLATHPAILRAFVVGVPDRRLSQIPVVFVIPCAHANAPTVAELQDFCKGRIAGFKIPRHVFEVDEVPGGFHKPQRHKLSAEAVRRLAPGGPVEEGH